MEGFAFTISMNDLLSAPAKKVSSALMATSKTALLLERSAKSMESQMAKSAAVGNWKAYAKQEQSLRSLNEALTNTDKGFAELAEPMGAATSAVLALTAATAGLIAKGAAFTISAVQEKQAAQQMFRAMAGGKAAGDQLFEMMEDLATQLPQTKDQLTAWSKEFTAMGVLKADALRTQLKATASAAALMGDSGAEAFMKFQKRIQESIATTGKLKLADKQLAALAETGANVSDVARQMGISATTLQAKLKAGTVSAKDFGDALDRALIQKGAGPLARLSGSMDVLQKKFSEAIGDIFEDVDISPFIDAMKDFLGIFTQGTESGKAMKTVFAGFFTSFFQLAGKAVLIAKTLFLGMIILGLKAYIAIKPFIPALKILGMVVAAAGLAFAATFLPAVAASIVALGSLIATAAVAAAPFVLIGAAVVAVYEAFTHWSEIKAIALKAFDWVGDLANNLIGGLVSGIERGQGLVVDAIRGLGHGAMKALKGVLGIASDSKEFMKIGGFSMGGLTTGMKRALPKVEAVSEDAGEAALGGARKTISVHAFSGAKGDTAAPSPKREGKKLSITVEKGAIQINGASGVLELTEQALALLLEKIALAEGLGEPG